MALTGISVHFHFYMTFAYFRLVVVLMQIYARWKRGQT